MTLKLLVTTRADGNIHNISYQWYRTTIAGTEGVEIYSQNSTYTIHNNDIYHSIYVKM